MKKIVMSIFKPLRAVFRGRGEMPSRDADPEYVLEARRDKERSDAHRMAKVSGTARDADPEALFAREDNKSIDESERREMQLKAQEIVDQHPLSAALGKDVLSDALEVRTTFSKMMEAQNAVATPEDLALLQGKLDTLYANRPARIVEEHALANILLHAAVSPESQVALSEMIEAENKAKAGKLKGEQLKAELDEIQAKYESTPPTIAAAEGEGEERI